MSFVLRRLAVLSNKKTSLDARDLFSRWKILRGDKVEILEGKDAGKQGEVSKVLRKTNRVVVAGLNFVTKHSAPQEGQENGKLIMESPIPVSKVSLLDPLDGKPTKVSFGYLQLADGTEKKVRYSRRSGSIIERPLSLSRAHGKGHVEGAKDTKPEEVFGSYIPTGNPLEYWQNQTKKFGKTDPFPKKAL